MPRRVGVVRHTLFLPSERFIPDQARTIPRWEPILLARDPVRNVPEGVSAQQLPSLGRVGRVAYALGARSAPIERAVRRLGLDLVHAHFGVEGMYSRRGALRAGVPHVVTLHGFDVTYTDEYLRQSRKVSWIRYAAGRSGLLASDSTFVCVSAYIRQRAVALGLDPARSVLIPTGVDTERLTPTPVPDAPRIAHVARLVEKKGTAVLLDAVASLRRDGIAAELDVVGDGPLRGELEGRVRRLWLDEAVRFHGAQDHAFVLDVIRRARVLCQPSLTAASGDSEGLGQAVLEAGALGRPVVGSDHGGIREIVTSGSNGLLVPEGDAAGLAQALGRVLREGDLAASLAAEGARVVRERFDLRTQSARLADLYDALVEGRPISDLEPRIQGEQGAPRS